MTIDRDYEEKVRMVYRGVEYEPNDMAYAQTDNSLSDHDRDSSLHGNEETDDRQNLKLYEERLVANKERFRSGAVTIGKRVETQTANLSVPVEKERIVIERNTANNGTVAAPGEATFDDGEVARVEVYEEAVNIEKQTFVREEVSVRKGVDRNIISAQETIRREELEVNTEGEVVVK